MALLEADGLSVAARKKVRTVLNRLWLEPREELANFVSRGVALHAADAPPMVLHWGVSIATYPFFAHVAEVVGRLTALQGDCAATEVHRRMSERLRRARRHVSDDQHGPADAGRLGGDPANGERTAHRPRAVIGGFWPLAYRLARRSCDTLSREGAAHGQHWLPTSPLSISHGNILGLCSGREQASRNQSDGRGTRLRGDLVVLRHNPFRRMMGAC
jgi:hypothetical protein